MARQLFVFDKPHSIIDVITNSSSELFIMDEGKTLSIIRAYLIEKCNDWGYQFFNCFLEPYVLETDEQIMDFWEKHKDYLTKLDWDDYSDLFKYSDALDKEVQEHMTDKNFLNSWRGKLIIESEGDNTIPWSVVEDIENDFVVKRYHVG